MFQYTTETIINSNEGNFPTGAGKVRFAALDNKGGVVSTGAAVQSPTAQQFLVDGVGLYQSEYITCVTKRAHVAAVNETLEITIDTTNVAAGDVVRLAVNTYQEGLVSSIYADAQLKHKKPFFYEIKVADPTTIAEEFAALITKEMSLTDFNFFKAEGSGAALTLTADDCYTRFATINIAKVPIATVTTANLGSVLTGWEDYDLVQEWERKEGSANGVVLTPGTEGAGTVARLIKNLRVPTDANTDPFAADNGGRPIPGGKYDQYVIEYTTPRKHIGGQVMGAKDESITTHVFFIESAITSDFENAIKAIKNITFEDAKTLQELAAVDTTAPAPGSKQ